MRTIILSDSHNHHYKIHNKVLDLIKPNESNILIHAGDSTGNGTEPEVKSFVNWFQALKGFDKKILIAGNHDFGFEMYNGVRHKNKPHWIHHIIDSDLFKSSDCVYLEDDEYIFNCDEFDRPLKIYGSPWQPRFHDWAFNLPRNGTELKMVWNNIPHDTDILITHGPPYGIRDYSYSHKPLGCELLLPRVQEIKPLIHCFGHIHYSNGVSLINDVTYVNASVCTEQYQPTNPIVAIDIKEVDGELLTFFEN